MRISLPEEDDIHEEDEEKSAMEGVDTAVKRKLEEDALRSKRNTIVLDDESPSQKSRGVRSGRSQPKRKSNPEVESNADRVELERQGCGRSASDSEENAMDSRSIEEVEVATEVLRIPPKVVDLKIMSVNQAGEKQQYEEDEDSQIADNAHATSTRGSYDFQVGGKRGGILFQPTARKGQKRKSRVRLDPTDLSKYSELHDEDELPHDVTGKSSADLPTQKSKTETTKPAIAVDTLSGSQKSDKDSDSDDSQGGRTPRKRVLKERVPCTIEECRTRLDWCLSQNLGIMDLSYCQMTDETFDEIFRSILSWKDSIWALRLNGNRLTSLPDEIGSFSCLKSLSIRDNLLSSLPKSLGDCKELLELDAAENELTEVPLELATMPHLHSLNLSCNQLSSFFDRSMDKSNVMLPSMSVLNLRHNKLNSICSKLYDSPLSVLDLAENSFLGLPKAYERLTSLRKLMIEKNPCIERIPKLIIRQNDPVAIVGHLAGLR